MRVIGLFRELDREMDRSLGSIHTAAGALPEAIAGAVANYLANGTGVFDVMGSTQDPFDKAQFIPGGPSLITDGDWIWRHDLAYLVRHYRVSLPDEFVRHVQEVGRPKPDLVVTQAFCDQVLADYQRAEKGKSA